LGPNQPNKKHTFRSDDRYRGWKHKLIEDHPFSGDSAKYRDTVEQTFRITFRMELRRRRWVGSVRLCHRHKSPRKCALSADENINFAKRSTMRYEENAHAYGDSPSPIIRCLLRAWPQD